ncbi:RNase P modulator RnpM [Chloroflexota bacterium]
MKTKNISSPYSTSTKYVPQRTCVACRTAKPKQELIRLVRTPDGNIEIDSSGRKAGRGAYLCRAWKCWEMSQKPNRLEQALRSSLTRNNCQQLIEQAKGFIKGAN